MLDESFDVVLQVIDTHSGRAIAHKIGEVELKTEEEMSRFVKFMIDRIKFMNDRLKEENGSSA